MEYDRIERLRELIRQEVARIVDQDLADPRIGFVSVTDVEVARDLSQAEVRISEIEGGDEDIEESLEGLRAASGYIKRLLGQRIHLRRMPELAFERDLGMDNARRVEDLLHRLEPTDESGSDAGS